VPQTAWLDETEQRQWRTFLRMQQRLFDHLVWHNQREFDLSAADYEVLVNLSETPGGRMRPAELAEATRWEKSRLSHHLTRMAQRGLICREPSDTNRYPDIVLTERGHTAITKAAPSHAVNVRAWFIDALGPERLARFAEDCETVCAALDKHGYKQCAHELDASTEKSAPRS
jgi:DNA-binding MarR family transcriptional regulator